MTRAGGTTIAERMRQVQTDSEQRQQKVSRTISQDQDYSELKERALVTHTPAAVDSPDDHVQHTATDELEKMDLSGMGLVQTKSAILAAENKSPDAASSPTTERLRASKQAYTKRREEVTALAPTNEQQRAPARTESEQALEQQLRITCCRERRVQGAGVEVVCVGKGRLEFQRHGLRGCGICVGQPELSYIYMC